MTTDDATPLADYGIVGDTRTAALVSSSGSLDWLCLPRFDGPPVFGRLVGGRAAGVFRMGPPAGAVLLDRRYRPGTATLLTTWDVGGARLTLAEGMVAELSGRLLPTTLLVRRLSVEGGSAEIDLEFDPRLGEERQRLRARRQGGALVCERGPIALSLTSSPALSIEPGRITRVRVHPGNPLTVALAAAHHEPLIRVDPGRAWELLGEDERAWAEWAAPIDPHIPSRPAVVRSALTLRLLTYSPSGAPVAAPTTSLPEQLGGERNWDYRYAWPRDASIGVGAFLGIGKEREANGFFWWLLHASRLQRPRLPVLLTLFGRPAPRERILPEWPGYAGSRPVRMGNAAADQHQLDGYGWVLEAAWQMAQRRGTLYAETWRTVRGYADLVARRWREPDYGIWEVRGGAAQHVHSKLMGWLALDRALRIAETHRLRPSVRRRWQAEREAIAADVRARGFDDSLGCYIRSYNTAELDAALLLLPALGLEDPRGDRVRSTIDAIRQGLSAGGPLIYRYPPGQDGLEGGEGAFLPCSFWLVRALAESGRRGEARQLFGELLDRATPLVLFGEEMDPETGAHLGNFPQALTHAALIDAALALREPGTATV